MARNTLNPNAWLLKYRKNYASQRGEDGILEKIFDIIPNGDKWCVEFGAWDGERFSNTWHLITHLNWSSVLIEADEKKSRELKERYSDKKNVYCIKQWVTFDGKGSLDNTLKKTPIPKNFDLISIDIDGADYHVWDAMKVYKPKVVLIEFNPTIPDDIDWVQPRDMSVRQGHSLLALNRLAKKKGYELICVNSENAFFVRKEYFPLFNIKDNSIATLHTEHKWVTRIFQLYDGNIVLMGNEQLCWHGIDMKPKLQVLPKWLRGFGDFKKYAFIGVLKRIGIYKPKWDNVIYQPPRVKWKKK